MPIQTQTLTGVSSALTSNYKPLTSAVDLDSEWAKIQAMVNADIRPSPQRLVEYALAASRDRTMFCPYEEERDKLIGLCADVLRNDEGNEKLTATEPLLKNLLIVLESDQPVGSLQLALAKQTSCPKP